MSWLGPLWVAFSMYSKIPVPQAEWNERNMRYSLCFFPLVGVFVGAALWLWFAVCGRLGIGPVLRGALGAAIPVLVSGGIHVDGFLDALDALSSRAEREKKLAILKDTHVGAFAAMGAVLYFLALAGAMSEADWRVVPAFVLSRALSALSLVTMKSASQGLLKAFADGARRRAVRVCSAAYVCALGALAVWLTPVASGAALCAMGLCYLYYWRMSARQFGGITGDLAGWFVTLSELMYLLAWRLFL